MPCPFLSAKIQTSDPGKKSGWCLPNSPVPPVFRAMDRNPSLYVFRCQKSMQKCKPPSFFLTSTTALHQALWLGLMAPDSSISFRWFLTSSTIGGGIHLKCSLNGVSSVTFMVCSVEWVHPSSTDLMKICHDTWQGAGGLYLPIWEPMSPSHLNPTHRTAYHVFA